MILKIQKIHHANHGTLFLHSQQFFRILGFKISLIWDAKRKKEENSIIDL